MQACCVRAEGGISTPILGAEEMAQWLGALATLSRRPKFNLCGPARQLTPIHTIPVPGPLAPSSDSFRSQEHIWYTYIHVDKHTHMHTITFRKSFYSNSGQLFQDCHCTPETIQPRSSRHKPVLIWADSMAK